MADPRRVLIIDDDDGALQGYGWILRASGFDVFTAHSGSEGLSRARQRDLDLVLADLRLPDLSGIDVLRKLRADEINTPFVIVTAWGTTRSAVEALQLGARDYVEKPLTGDDLVHVVERALSQTKQAGDADLEAHAAARWAASVVTVIDSPEDPKTFKGWSRCAAASPGTLKNWCRTAGVSPRRSLVLARLLRAVVLREIKGYRLTDLLNVADTRTLMSLLKLAGFESHGIEALPHNTREFLEKQSLVTDRTAISALSRALNRRWRKIWQ
jgi:FixJ family two-component response regulator